MRITGVANIATWLILAAIGSAGAQEAYVTPVAVEAPLSAPEPAEALRLGVERATADLEPATRQAILGFYAARGFAPFWTEPGLGSYRGAELLAALEAAPEHGLPLRRYDPGALQSLLAEGADPGQAGLVEVGATRTYLSFARDLTSGVLTPSRIDDEINVAPDRPTPAALLALVAASPVRETLAALEPASPEYRRLMAEKARLEAEVRDADWGPEIAAGPTLRLGEASPRVAALRARLAARGFDALPGEVTPATALRVAATGAGDTQGVAADRPQGNPSAPALAAVNIPPAADPARFDAGLEAALERFQTEAGLEADGLAGPQTQAAVNEGPEAALGQVIVNLERLRWMNLDLGPRYVWANIPDFSVQVIEDGAVVYSSRTVVGKAVETRTPEFSENMTYFVVNPTWHIPDSIARRVYLPKLKANANTLANSNMRIFTRAGTEINPGLVDFNQFEPGNFPFRIKQNPSTANALGRVKFMFPNQFSIYLHDTPLRDLFAKEVRAFSNGCVRLEDPLELAYLLLEGQVANPEAAFAGWLAGGAEHMVQLERPIPVHLVYRTVFVDASGALRRRFDVYGRDERVLRALVETGVTLPGAQG